MTDISCLPIAGIENPYQKLMMEGLAQDPTLRVRHGENGKLFAILKTVIKHRPDYLHFDWIHQYYLRRTSWMTWINYPLFITQIFIVKYLFRVKIIWTLHNITPHDRAFTGPAKWSRKYFAKSCDVIRVFGPSTIKFASKILGTTSEKFMVIPEGSYVDYYPNTISKKKARSKLGLGSSNRIFLFFGGIRPYKGIEELIKTFLQYKQDNWNLIIAGNSLDLEYLASVLKLIDDDSSIRIDSNGVPVDQVQYYMKSADVVVLPFKKIENSGSTILAMGFKKAVIAPNIGVLPKRLIAQKELLYSIALSEIFSKINQFNFDAIGQMNYDNVVKYKWSDYAEVFQ